MPYSIDDLERMFFQNEYAPRTSDGKVIARKNYLLNPGFKQNASYWQASGSGALSWEAGYGVYTNGAAALAANAILFFTPNTQQQQTPVKGGEIWSGSIYVTNTTAVTQDFTMTVAFFDEPGVTLLATRTTNTPIAAGATVRLSMTQAPAPSTAVKAGLYVYVGATALPANAVIKFSNALLEKSSSVGTYFDGDSTDDNWTDYRWEGTANASASLAVEPEPTVVPYLTNNIDPLLVRSPSDSTYYMVETNISVTKAGDTGLIVEAVAAPLSGGTWAWSVPVSYIQDSKYTIVLDVEAITVSNIRVAIPGTDINTNEVFTLIPGQNRIITFTGTATTTAGNRVYMEHRGPVGGKYIARSIAIFEGTSGVPVTSYKLGWTGTPHSSKSKVIDTNSRDSNFTEAAYYKKNSGLSVGTAADHERAFLIANHKAVAGDASYVSRKNLVVNGSFESGITNFTAASNTSLAQSSTQSYSGTKSLEIKAVADGNILAINGAYDQPDRLIPVQQGKTYRLEGKFKAQGTGRTVRIDYSFSNGSATGLGYTNGTDFVDNSSTWTTTYQNVTIPVGVSYLRIVPIVVGCLANEIHYLDDVFAEELTTYTEYFDGNTKYARWDSKGASEMTDPTKMTNGELLRSRFMAGSGLPATASTSDHEMAFYKSKLGVS